MNNEDVSTVCPLDSTIKQLKQKRDNVQKGSYTKWINSILAQEKMEAKDLVNDLRDGRILFKLLERLSGERLGKLNAGNQTFHHMDNVNRCLTFLKKRKIPLEGISAAAIVDGNEKTILGLVGAIQIHYEMNGLRGPAVENKPSKTVLKEENDDEKHKATLLQWCQKKTSGYNGVKLQDFTKSWYDGLGFNALIHSHRPDLVDYDSLDSENPIENLRNAFDIAKKHLRVTNVLEEKDFINGKPDEYPILIYVARLYQVFNSSTEKNASKSQYNQNGVHHEIEELKKSSVMKKAAAAYEELQKEQPRINAAILKSHPSYSAKKKPSTTKGINKDDGHESGSEPTSMSLDFTIPEVVSWECTECSFLNSPVSPICDICFSKPSETTSLKLQANDTSNAAPNHVDQHEDFTSDETEDVPDRHQDKNTEEENLPEEETETNDLNDQKEISKFSIDDVLQTYPLDSLGFKGRRQLSVEDPSWACPGCQHINPDTTKVCELCFRTLRQLKCLSFDDLGLGKIYTKRISHENEENGDFATQTSSSSSSKTLNGNDSKEDFPSST